MNTYLAEQMCKAEMRKHGLTEWRFSWNRRKRAAGVCKSSIRTIELSAPYVSLNNEDDVLETILHEIAHALTPGHNHDSVWRRKALEIGANGKPCAESHEAFPEPTWKAVCKNGCPTGRGFHRAPLRVKACSRCCGGRFKPEAVLSWRKQGREVSLTEMPSRYVQEMLYLRSKYGNRVNG